MRKHFTPRKLALAAMIAAIYTAVSLCIPMLTYGVVQVRFAEALTLLPVLHPISILGVTLGCAITNAIGAASGLNLPIDIFVGTTATLLAAILSYKARNIRFLGLPVLSSLFPVLLNAVLVGGELTLLGTSGWNTPIFVINALSVGAGELLSCCVLGLALIAALERKHVAQKLFGTI